MKKNIILVIFFLTNFLYSSNFSKYETLYQKYSAEYNVPIEILKAITLVENTKLNPTLVCMNKNGTKDVGLMQINTLWIDALPKMKLTVEKLKTPETNIKVASYILGNLIQKYGLSWETIGMYHSRTITYQFKYIYKVQKKLKLVEGQN